MPTENTKPYIPLAGGADDGWSKEDEATATCYCGAVQLVFVSSLSHALLNLKGITNSVDLSQLKVLAWLTPSSATVQTVVKSQHRCLHPILSW